MQLPIPSVTKQKEILAEYNSIQNRIRLNEQLIQKLEETAQAIYKQWFVEFEFADEINRVMLNNYVKTNPQLNLIKNELATYVEMNDLTTSSKYYCPFKQKIRRTAIIREILPKPVHVS